MFKFAAFFQNTFSSEHLWVAASANTFIYMIEYPKRYDDMTEFYLLCVSYLPVL